MIHEKRCSKCEEIKDSSEYYTSSRACKECVKKATKLRGEILRSTPEGLEKERERHREKYHRLNYKEVHKPTTEKKREIIKRYNEKYPEKLRAKSLSQDIPLKVKGNQVHHWNYNTDFAKDIFDLDAKDHARLHRFLIYDEVTFTYKTKEGVVLDTKEKHREFINSLEIEIYN